MTAHDGAPRYDARMTTTDPYRAQPPRLPPNIHQNGTIPAPIAVSAPPKPPPGVSLPITGSDVTGLSLLAAVLIGVGFGMRRRHA